MVFPPDPMQAAYAQMAPRTIRPKTNGGGLVH